MKIDVVKIHFKNEYGDNEWSYKYYPFEYCCNHLKYSNEIISFGTEGNTIHDEEGYLTQLDDESPHFSIHWEEPIPYEDDTWTEYTSINFCPFCGEKIDINVVKKEDKSLDYATMSTLRNMLNERRRKTDSKKENEELDKEIYELDKKLNAMWTFGEYTENP